MPKKPASSQPKGVFIAIEGTDGSGKTTQFKLLVERLKAAGYRVSLFDFPQYDKPSSYFVKQYLNGEYGSGDEVGPYTGSLFYALDRFEASSAIRQALERGDVVLANRFTGSNMAHQGSKFEASEQRRGFFIWADGLEFQMLGIPRPDRNFVLRVPSKIAQELVGRKEPRSYTSKSHDIHEADINHLEKSLDAYDDLCRLFPKDYVAIDCTKNNQLLSVPAINNRLWEAVKPLLPKPHGKGRAKQLKVPTSHIDKKIYAAQDKAGRWKMTDEGRAFLKDAVTDVSGNVYAFTEKLSPLTVAAAMARLSRRADDMRITILDEFADAADKDNQLLHRVITAYGDDSVQQLTGIHVVVEGASNLLTKKLEWGRLAAYLEQSTRYIYFDQKDEQGNYKYVVPENLDSQTKRQYRAIMDRIFDNYSALVHQLTDYVQHHSSTPESERDGPWRAATKAQACDAARAALPVAVKSTVGIFASGQALENLIMSLMADELQESRKTGEYILREARKVIPAFLERADKPDRGGATIAYRATTKQQMAKAADKLLKQTSGKPAPEVQLTDYWPKNELDLVADMLYEHSDLPLAVLRRQVNDWSYKQKANVFATYMGDRLNRRHRPGRALEKAHYSWDLVCDYGIFRDLQRHRMVDDLEWQHLSPRCGYDVPPLIDKAGLNDIFEACFDLSQELYQELVHKGYALEAQYATLLGHKMRWKITYNAREAFHLHELRTAPQGHPGYRKLVFELHQKLTEVHPLTAGAMKFVNKDEDPELTRLAAERYTQFKLDQLEKAQEK